MSKPRDTSKYEIRQGNKVVYVGVTNDLDRRAAEHERAGKQGNIHKIGNNTTREAAEKWESGRLETYRKNHRGNNPQYNQTDHG